MKKADVVIGQKYVAKISGKLTVVRLDRHAIQGGWYATNVSTGRPVRIRTAAKLRRAAILGWVAYKLSMAAQKELLSVNPSPQWPNATQRSRM